MPHTCHHRRCDCQQRCISLLIGIYVYVAWGIVQPRVAKWPIHVSHGMEEGMAFSKAKVHTFQEVEPIFEMPEGGGGGELGESQWQ